MTLPVTLPDDPVEASAYCLRHHRLIQWIPAPGWWIHYPDCTTCDGCLGAPAPIQFGWLPSLPGYAGWTPGREADEREAAGYRCWQADGHTHHVHGPGQPCPLSGGQ